MPDGVRVPGNLIAHNNVQKDIAKESPLPYSRHCGIAVPHKQKWGLATQVDSGREAGG